MHGTLGKIEALTKRRWLRNIVVAAGLALAFFVIGNIVYRNRADFQTFPWRLNPWPLVGAAVALVITFGLNVLMWSLISRTFGSQVGFWKDVEIYSFSTVVRRLPGAIWQLAGRTYLYYQADTTLAVPLWGTFWELVVQITSAMLLTLLMLVLSPRLLSRFPGGFFWLFLLIPIGWLVLRPQDVAVVAKRVAPSVVSDTSITRRTVAVWLGLYTLIWTMGGAILYLLICAFGQHTWHLFPVSVGIVAASGVLSIIVSPIPGGLGLREITLTLLLQLYVQSPVAVTVAILLRLVSLLGEALIAFVVFLAARGKAPRQQPGRNTS
jgi:uncharacterized membrane protein YbhN (UPF0104 family)